MAKRIAAELRKRSPIMAAVKMQVRERERERLREHTHKEPLLSVADTLQ